MDRNEELINRRYDALMFARNPEEAKRSARLLADAVLGEEGLGMSLERAMKEVCRRIRPAADSRDQARFEAEFLEFVFAPTGEGVVQISADQQRNRSKAA